MLSEISSLDIIVNGNCSLLMDLSPKPFLQKYMDSVKKQVDTTFGIRYDNGVPVVGGNVIKIDGDNIVIDAYDDDDVYVGTPGLWSLITGKVRKKLR